jgi:hypothetical protein
MARQFDRYIMVDWSARSKPAPARPSPDAIWIRGEDTYYCRTRPEAEALLASMMAGGGRLLVGFDIGFTMAAWVHRTLGLDWLAFWEHLDSTIEDEPLHNNRFEVAAQLNRRLSGHAFPFWATPHPNRWLGAKRPTRYTAERPEWREPEVYLRERMNARPQSSFKLYTTGSVGSQILLGLPVLARLRRRFAGEVTVWPFEGLDRRIVFAEVYPSLFPFEDLATKIYRCKDEQQVIATARLMGHADDLGLLGEMLELPPEATQWREEGWIFGANAHRDRIVEAVLYTEAR